MSDPRPESAGSKISATPQYMIKSEVYIPENAPPYETPLDLRYPLHWDSRVEYADTPEEGSNNCPQHALELAQAEIQPLGVLFNYGYAFGMCHYPGLSPGYFRVDFDEAHEDTWKYSHETVVQTILKHFGYLEEFQKPVIRYVRSSKVEWDEDF